MARKVDQKQEVMEAKCITPSPERALPFSVVIGLKGFKNLLNFRLNFVQKHILSCFLTALLCFKVPSGFLDYF